MLDMYGIDSQKAAKLAEQFGISAHPVDASHPDSPVMVEPQHGLGDLHQMIHDATAAHQLKQDRGEKIEEDFAHKLIDYKTKSMGSEYRLFGHTMVSFEQLTGSVKHD